MGNALVQHHGDIAAQGFLNLHRLFRCQKMRRPIDMRLKVRAILGDLAHGAETENLIAAAICQDRPGPIHEAMQPAQFAYQLMTGPQIKMICIAEQDLTPQLV